MKRIVILFSGNGSNLEAIANKLHGKSLTIAKAITNNPEAGGIERAKRYGIPVQIINHKDFKSREAFDQKLVEEIEKVAPDLVVLAGFMRILTPVFTSRIKNALNVHPSLLPLFKGANALRKSYESGMRVAGVTVHWVSEELDGGEIIDQSCFHRENESFEEFEAKIHTLEHELYPAVIEKILQGKYPQRASLSLKS